jgi:sec-independent protein translocase protein TatA
MFTKIGTTELLLILAVALLIFGPTKLPKLGKALGQTIGNFKRSATAAEKGEDKVGSKKS